MPYQLQAVELQRIVSAAITSQQRPPGSTVHDFRFCRRFTPNYVGVSEGHFSVPISADLAQEDFWPASMLSEVLMVDSRCKRSFDLIQAAPFLVPLSLLDQTAKGRRPLNTAMVHRTGITFLHTPFREHDREDRRPGGCRISAHRSLSC